MAEGSKAAGCNPVYRQFEKIVGNDFSSAANLKGEAQGCAE